MIRNPTKLIYEFGPFRLDPAEHILLREDQPVSLPPKVFEILRLLVANGGHLFEKDELMKAVWPDSFVEEGNLTRNISTLRTALGEGAGDHKYIETVPKCGYRFVEPVREVNGSGTAASPMILEPAARVTDVPNLDQAQDARTSYTNIFARYRGWAIFALAAATLMGLGYGMFSWRAAIAHQPEIKAPQTALGLIKPEASHYYWQARLHTNTENRLENDSAIELLEKAVAADPNFALAYATLAYEYHLRAVALKPEERDEWEAKALAAVNEALKIDPNLPEAHVTRAAMLWGGSKQFNHQQAIAELHRALDLNPGLDEAHHQLGIVYSHIGLLDKGELEIKRAIALEPSNPGAQFRVGVNLLYQSRYQEALDVFRETRKYNRPLWSYQTAFAFFQLGKKEEAAATIAEAFKNSQQDEGGLLTAIEAMLAASDGDTVKAEQKIMKAAELGKNYIHFHHTEYAIASAYAIMNKRTQAMDWLQRTADDGFPCYPLFQRDPNLQNLRQDPHFIAFMAKLKEQWERYRATL